MSDFNQAKKEEQEQANLIIRLIRGTKRMFWAVVAWFGDLFSGLANFFRGLFGGKPPKPESKPEESQYVYEEAETNPDDDFSKTESLKIVFDDKLKMLSTAITADKDILSLHLKNLQKLLLPRFPSDGVGVFKDFPDLLEKAENIRIEIREAQDRFDNHLQNIEHYLENLKIHEEKLKEIEVTKNVPALEEEIQNANALSEEFLLLQSEMAVVLKDKHKCKNLVEQLNEMANEVKLGVWRNGCEITFSDSLSSVGSESSLSPTDVKLVAMVQADLAKLSV